MAFRGPVLAERLYGDITARQFADVDLLVKPHDVQAVGDFLVGDGYRPQFSLDRLPVRRTRSGFSRSGSSSATRSVSVSICTGGCSRRRSVRGRRGVLDPQHLLAVPGRNRENSERRRPPAVPLHPCDQACVGPDGVHRRLRDDVGAGEPDGGAVPRDEARGRAEWRSSRWNSRRQGLLGRDPMSAISSDGVAGRIGVERKSRRVVGALLDKASEQEMPDDVEQLDPDGDRVRDGQPSGIGEPTLPRPARPVGCKYARLWRTSWAAGEGPAFRRL